VFQDYALFPNMSVRENIGYGGGDVEGMAELLEIGHLLDRGVRDLSGGEKQRVALARALCFEPEVLLMDEPLSSLDAPIRRRLRHELGSLLGELGIPVLYVTHDQEESMVVGDRLAVVGDGVVHQRGRPEEGLRRPGNRFVAAFMGAENVFEGEVSCVGDGFAEVEWSGGTVEGPRLGFSVEDEVEFCVRPEDIMIIREGKPLRKNIRENMFEGRVVSRVNRGATYTIRVELVSGEDVVIVVPDHAYHRLGMDEREEVTVSFKRDRVHLMEAS